MHTSVRLHIIGVCVVMFIGSHGAATEKLHSEREPVLLRSLERTEMTALPPDARMTCAAFGGPGRILVATKGGEIWDLSEDGTNGKMVVFMPESRIWNVACDRSGNALFCSTAGGVVYLSSPRGHVVWKDSRLQMDIGCVDISRDGRLFATTGDDMTTVRVWRTMDHTLVTRFSIDGVLIKGICFSADASLIAVTTHDGAEIRKTDSANLVGVISREGTVSRAVCFMTSSDNERLCIAYKGSPASIECYDTKAWQRHGETVFLREAEGVITGLCGHGERLACIVNATPQKSIGFVLIDPSGRMVVPATGTGDVVQSFVFSANGKSAIDLTSKRIRIWTMQPQEE